MTEFDSLILGNKIELLGGPGGVASIEPSCAGAIFKLQPGFDMGAPQPDVDFLQTFITDGERPYGTRASDRTCQMTIHIHADSFKQLEAAREFLYQTIDQQFWTTTWTRRSEDDDFSLPLVLDCFRAQPTTNKWGGVDELFGEPVAEVTITFLALPYGRADQQEQVAFATPVATFNAPTAPPNPITLDDFSTINSTQFSQSTTTATGSFSGFWDPNAAPANSPDGSGVALQYGAQLAATTDITGQLSINFYLGLGSRYFFNLDYRAKVRLRCIYKLIDINGVELEFANDTRNLPVSQDPASPVFSYISAALPLTHPTFDYTRVVAYELLVYSKAPRFGFPVGELKWLCAYLNKLHVNPSTQVTAAASTRGNIYTVYGVKGTVRTPCSMQFQVAPSAGTPTSITATGAGSYTVPANTLYLKVEAWGGGGAGATETTTGVGGGGGGGEYAREENFASAVGQSIPYIVGTGGTPGSPAVDGAGTVFGPGPSGPLFVAANGGKSALQNSINAGLGGTGSTNSIHYDGGPGRTASGSVGGGGGSGAGNAAPGTTPTGTSATVFSSGSSTWLCPAGVTQVLAECWGAGGGGGNNSVNSQGGGGGGGEYAAQFVAVTPGNSYPYVVGAGGGGNSGTGGGTGTAGGDSTFTGDNSVVVRAHGGLGGFGALGSGAAGGSGSSNSTHFNGGRGGASYPYTGGGGSSAGTAAAGNTGGTPGAASAPSGGGAGGAGSGFTSNPGSNGSAPGGGGGGANASGHAGGSGAAGQVRLTFPGGAPTNNGATAPTGGGNGGAGGGSSNTAGSAGSQPGGGGGGADSGGTSEAGGAGGAGKIIVTPFQLTSFKTLIVHRPSTASPKSLSPFVSVGNGANAPGSTEYTIPSLISGLNARFDGTYMLLLIASSFNTPTASRTIGVSIKQYEYSGGPATTIAATSVSLIPNSQVTNGIVRAGVVTLPQRALPADNTEAVFTALVSDTNSSDRFLDLLILDVRGQTIVVNEPSTGYPNYYIDEPDPHRDQGLILGSPQDGRKAAVSVSDQTMMSGGPIMLEPGDNTFMAYSVDGGAPAIGLSYFPRYAFGRPS